MRKINIFTVFLITVITAVTLASPTALALSDPEIEADSALLVETISGKILYEKNKDRRVAPGSISKVMTLLLAVEAVENGQAGLKDTIIASETFIDGIGENDTVQQIKPGEELSFEDLLYAMYLVSANDACNILAETIGGAAAGFVQKMNDRAEALGCNNTYFANAGGRIDASQYTSAWDQYLIFREAVNHPLFLQIAGTVSYTMKATDVSPERILLNTNAMLRSDSGYYYKFSIAGKSASSSEYGYSYVSYAKDNRLSLISVVFGVKPDGQENSSDTIRSYTETTRLFEWGFDSYSWQAVINKYEIAATEKIEMARGTDTIDLLSAETMTILARRDLEAQDIIKDIVIYGQHGGKSLAAPVKQGDILGVMTVYVDDEICGKINLTAADTIELDRARFITDQISVTLSKFWVQFGIFVFLVLIGYYGWLVVRDYKKRRARKRRLEETKRAIIEERRRQKIHK